MESGFKFRSPNFIRYVIDAGRKRRLEQESRLEQIVVNMMNFMNAIDRSGVEVRNKEMPHIKKISGVVGVGLHVRNPILEQRIDHIARECGATQQFTTWEISHKGRGIGYRYPMYEAIQTYIFTSPSRF